MTKPTNPPTPTYLEAFEAWMRRGTPGLSKDQRRLMEATSAQQHRQQGTSPGAAGGFLTNPDFFQELIVRLDARSGLRRFGRTITTQTGASMSVPRLNDVGNEGDEVPENDPIPPNDLIFEQATLGSVKHTSGEIVFSNELLQDALIGIPGLLGDAIGRRIGRARSAVETANLIAGITTIGAGGAAPDADDVKALFYAIRPDYREEPSTAWLMTDEIADVLRDVAVSGMGIPWWMPGASASDPDRLLGKNVYISNDLEAIGDGNVSIVFGAGELGFWIRDVQGVRVERLEERRALTGGVSFVGWMRGDGAVVDPDAIIGLLGSA